MRKKDLIKTKNYLDKKPIKKMDIQWTKDADGNITIEIENKKIADKIAQKLLKKPKISYVHLDETGNFIWPFIDGENDIFQIGKMVHEEFKEKAEPLYERLVQYFNTLENCGFIEWKDD